MSERGNDEEFSAAALRLGGYLCRWFPWLSEETAPHWAEALLDEFDRRTIAKAVDTAAKKLLKKDVCFAAVRRFCLDEQARTAGAEPMENEEPKLSPEQGHLNAIRGAVCLDVAFGLLDPAEFEREVARRAEEGPKPAKARPGRPRATRSGIRMIRKPLAVDVEERRRELARQVRELED